MILVRKAKTAGGKFLPLNEIKHEECSISKLFRREEDFSKEVKDSFIPTIAGITGYEILKDTVHTEVNANGKRADIVCEIDGSEAEDGNRTKIIIENKFGESDHKHLGQCVRYAANKDARIVIWICEKFQPVDLDALRWLNEKLRGEIGFYALKVIAYKGENFHDGHTRMHFDVLEQPDLNLTLRQDGNHEMRFLVLNKTQERFNEISSKHTIKECWNPDWGLHHLDRNKFGKCIAFYWQHATESGEYMQCNAKLRVRDGYRNKMDPENVWKKLVENKKMIDKRLSGIEWRDPNETNQKTYSLRTYIPVNEGIENISDERKNEIVNKLAEDMKQLTEIVEELKLDDEIIYVE